MYAGSDYHDHAVDGDDGEDDMLVTLPKMPASRFL